jgi:arsenate reductase (thioredoxin)
VKVLFMCTANSCRSQMAEAWARRLFPEGWQVASAGIITYPITDRTREAMAEVGIAMEGQHSKPLDGFDLDEFDLVVTLSRESGQFLPRLARPERHWRRPITDPMGLQGRDEDLRAAFARARDQIRDIVQEVGAALGSV